MLDGERGSIPRFVLRWLINWLMAVRVGAIYVMESGEEQGTEHGTLHIQHVIRVSDQTPAISPSSTFRSPSRHHECLGLRSGHLHLFKHMATHNPSTQRLS